jgi:hypothetical protein
MSLIAKPIVENKLWLITDNGIKVGNLELTNKGYNLKLHGKQFNYDSTKTVEELAKIEFDGGRSVKPAISYAKWPTDSKTYNDVFDVKRKLHIYTKTKSSKCYHAAGWFNMNVNGQWQTIFCPKYIFVTRYEYNGPYMSEEEATKH